MQELFYKHKNNTCINICVQSFNYRSWLVAMLSTLQCEANVKSPYKLRDRKLSCDIRTLIKTCQTNSIVGMFVSVDHRLKKYEMCDGAETLHVAKNYNLLKASKGRFLIWLLDPYTLVVLSHNTYEYLYS